MATSPSPTPTATPLANAGGNIRKLCKRTWWVFLIGGLASVGFGILAFANPASGMQQHTLYDVVSAPPGLFDLLRIVGEVLQDLIHMLNGL